MMADLYNTTKTTLLIAVPKVTQTLKILEVMFDGVIEAQTVVAKRGFSVARGKNRGLSATNVDLC